MRRFPGLFLTLWSAASLCAQEGPFGAGLYQVMEKAACRSCHNPDGVASATRLHFPEPDAAPDKVEAFGRSLVILVDRRAARSLAAAQQADQPHSARRRGTNQTGQPGRSGPEGVDSKTDAAFRASNWPGR